MVWRNQPVDQLRVVVARRKNEPNVSVCPYTLRRRLDHAHLPRSHSVTLAPKPRKMSGVFVITNVHCLHIAHRLRYDGPMYHIHIPFHKCTHYFGDGKSCGNAIFWKTSRSMTKMDRYSQIGHFLGFDAVFSVTNTRLAQNPNFITLHPQKNWMFRTMGCLKYSEIASKILGSVI